ncbi:MAG: 16S rRNA (cytosine(967)-C(5))-methyltransferase RsmB [Proteobacteria bacterium]|nr:16S rRNA (cytosine(967)-C(5))-methyltransferase RsmB [Pseudomonadota bacterium]
MVPFIAPSSPFQITCAACSAEPVAPFQQSEPHTVIKPNASIRRHPKDAPPRRARPAPVQLPPDSLGFALQQSALLVAAVLDGANLTDRFEFMLQAHPAWPESTRGAVRDLAWSTLRQYGRGDAILKPLLHVPPPVFVRALLLVALHRLERRPEQGHTIVDQTVQAVAAEMPGLKGMVNAVLRNALRQKSAWPEWIAADEAARYGHPRWWLQKVRRAHPDAWEAALAAGNEHPPMALRVNRRRSTVEEALGSLQQAGLSARRLANDALLLDRPVAVARLPGHAEGLLSVQDAGAQWAATLLDARPGERVLDACAAPGGKSAHLLERADIELLALELDPARAERIRRNLARLGLSARIQVADCRDLPAWWDGRPFDRILADVPCSASGVARRHPDIKWLRREDDIRQFAAQQGAILDALWQTLVPGGTMLYVTCSVFDDENRLQIERFLSRHGDAAPLPIDNRPDLQLLPNAEHDGFYFALLRKLR